MAKTSRNGIGRIAVALAVLVVVVLALGVSIALRFEGPNTSSTSSTTSTISTSETSSSTTTSSSVLSTTSSNETSFTSSTTNSSSTVPVGCVFSPPGPLIVSASTHTVFTGCLTAGATGVYLLGIADVNGIIVQGVIRAQYPCQITMAGAPVGNLTAGGNGGLVTSGNDTTVLSMPDVLLFGNRGYSITVVNQSGQNDTVTMILNLSDAAAFEA